MRLAALLALVALFLWPGVARAAKLPDAACWFAPDVLTLYAVNLPTNDTFAVTYEPWPVGTHLTSADGTFAADVLVPAPLTAYFWQRGGGRSLLKPGAQLNDYHVIATCSA